MRWTVERKMWWVCGTNIVFEWGLLFIGACWEERKWKRSIAVQAFQKHEICIINERWWLVSESRNFKWILSFIHSIRFGKCHSHLVTLHAHHSHQCSQLSSHVPIKLYVSSRGSWIFLLLLLRVPNNYGIYVK